MLITSAITGIFFGIIWGVFFVRRFQQACPHNYNSNQNSINSTPQSTKRFFKSIAITSTLRFLLLATLLIFLVVNQYVVLGWWLAGFMGAFWGVIYRSGLLRSKD